MINPNSRSLRVLFDTNIYISYLLTNAHVGTIATIVEAMFGSTFTLLIVDELLSELRNSVSTKKYLAQRITSADLDRLITILHVVAEAIPPIKEAIPAVTRDPKDDYLLAYALVGQADYLVTGDDDLLAFNTIGSLTIIKPHDFMALIMEKL
ncbi:MAG: hypothetical protein NVS4B8_29700 [Herpetosiphon sp.]